MSIFARPKIGLALGSGGTRGLAHIGIIKVLVKHKIPIDFIAGSSAGALIGGMYAALGDINKIEQIARDITYRDFLKALSDPSWFSGILKGDRATGLLEKYIGRVRIENLKIPFRAVATDIKTGRTVAIGYGSLAKAIRASCSVPLLFKPLILEKFHLIDGGTSQPVPVRVIKEMGADKVIAVNPDDVFFSENSKINKKQKLSTISILRSSLNLLRYHLARENVKEADIVITPKIPEIPLTKLLDGGKLIPKGEEAMERKIPMVKELLKGKFVFT